MEDDHCSCGSNTSDRTESDESTGGRRSDTPVLDTELPESMQSSLGALLGRESVSSLAEWATGIRSQTDGDGIGLSDLCLTEEETDHWGVLDGERYDFLCFYDAVIMAGIADGTVDVHTTSPDGTPIEIRAIGSEIVDVTPQSTVFSFGIDPSVLEASDDSASLERAYTAICPYVRAFPDMDTYERWAMTVDAETIAMPIGEATVLAGLLVE